MKTKMRSTLGLIFILTFAPGMVSYDANAKTGSTNSASLESANGLGWDIEIVDKKGGFSSALVLDVDGYPQIAYQAAAPVTPHELNYARWDGSQWVIDVVDTQGDTGWVVDALGIDKAGNPHIGYGGNQYAIIKYAHWTGSDWIIEDVGYDPSDLLYSGASFAFDSNGYPHFAYCAQNWDYKIELRYAHWTGSSWSIEPVDGSGCWYSTSLRLDANDSPAVSYYDDNQAELKFTRWTGAEWDVQVIDSSGNVGLPNTLTLDADGNPHISYYSFTYEKLKYAAWTGADWEIQDVDSIVGPINRLDISLVLDAGDQPHIAYVDGNLKYAYLIDNTWVIDTVDRGEFSVSMRLDAAGNPHISYNGPSFELKYAVGSPYQYFYLPLIK